VVAFQSHTVASPEAAARTFPSGEKAIALTQLLWPSSVCFQAPVVAFQSRTVLSFEADGRTLPSGEKVRYGIDPITVALECLFPGPRSGIRRHKPMQRYNHGGACKCKLLTVAILIDQRFRVIMTVFVIVVIQELNEGSR
jgi:hypothetical protein